MGKCLREICCHPFLSRCGRPASKRAELETSSALIILDSTRSFTTKYLVHIEKTLVAVVESRNLIRITDDHIASCREMIAIISAAELNVIPLALRAVHEMPAIAI